MKLISDDVEQTYFWVDDLDADHVLSPRFDYEEDAIQWVERMKAEIYSEGN